MWTMHTNIYTYRMCICRTLSSGSAQTGSEGVRVWMTGRSVGQVSLLIDQWGGMDTYYEGM